MCVGGWGEACSSPRSSSVPSEGLEAMTPLCNEPPQCPDLGSTYHYPPKGTGAAGEGKYNESLAILLSQKPGKSSKSDRDVSKEYRSWSSGGREDSEVII